MVEQQFASDNYFYFGNVQLFIPFVYRMWIVRGRGRNLRLVIGLLAFLIVFLYLEFDSVKTSKEEPLLLIHRNKYGRSAVSLKTCKAHTNLAYIKMIKCGSTTLASMFRRFGFHHNLSFVLPHGGKIYLGWPYPFQVAFHRKKKAADFNILCEHVVYNKEYFRTIMPSDTVFLTSLREPFSQFKSTFHYYKISNISQMNPSEGIREYLMNIEMYEERYKSPNNRKFRYCIPDGLSMTRNQMAFTLGFPNGFNAADQSDNSSYVKEWISALDHDLSLVIILEYFHESLVLLRRLLCWNFEDVLFVDLNVGEYNYKENVDGDLVQIYHQWSGVDYALYDHFNRTLWIKLANQEPDFWQEVSHLKSVTHEISRYCSSFPQKAELHQGISSPNVVLQIEPSPWHGKILIDKYRCDDLMREYLSEIKDKYDKTSPHIQNESPSLSFC